MAISRGHAVGAVVSLLLLVAAPGAAEDPATLPVAGQAGPRPAWNPDTMQGPEICEASCSGSIAGWDLVVPGDRTGNVARRLEGEVVAGHLPHGDFYFNHGSEDHNIFVNPDNQNPLANFPAVNYETMLGRGNYLTGPDKEHGRVEVETEYGKHTWNDSPYYGFPAWAWPNIGDRVLIEGYWICDCGHSPSRTEIHPAWMVVTYRNAMQGSIARGSNRKGWVAPLGPDDKDYARVTRADVYISSYGGEAVDNIFDDDDFYGPDFGMEDWWQPVNSKDYEFYITAPIDKPAGAELMWKVLDPPSDFIYPPGYVSPSYEITKTTKNGREAVRVHIPFTSVSNSLHLLFAKTILVGYDVKEPEVKQLRVNFTRFNVFDDLEGVEQASWSSWAHSGDQNAHIRVSNGIPDEGDPIEWVCDSDENYMAYCEPDEDENNYAEATFDRYLGPEDQLVISVRAKEGDQPLDENDGAGIADQAFTAAENFGVGTHTLRQQVAIWSGDFQEDECDGPGGACFETTYTVERIMTPTATSLGVPAVQYAQDPNLFTATVFTPGSPDKPRRRLPVGFAFTNGPGLQWLVDETDDNGLADPHDLLTLPAGDYLLTANFAGNGLLSSSFVTQTVTIAKDFTASTLDAPDEMRWGHHDPMSVTLIETNVGQAEPPLPIVGKMMVITLSGLLGTQEFIAGPTDAQGAATIEPLLTLPPGNYEAVACFVEDAWFLGSCSVPQPVKVTAGFAGFAKDGPITISGTGHTSLGDLHSETSIDLHGTSHTLSAAAGERLEYATTFTDGSTGSTYNLFQVPPLGIAPQYLVSTYCSGAADLLGVPITYVTGDFTAKNNAVLSGIYCVTGNIKIQSRVTGTATLVGAGPLSTITTAGGDQNLTTADPTGADVLLLTAAQVAKAITLGANEARFTGAVVAGGGVEVSSIESVVDTAIIAKTITVKGDRNVLDGR
jgi:hypothetical protein